MTNYYLRRGFTLIELMVSIAIFSVVMVMALGALLSISEADRKSETVASVMNNLNFAVESMTRNIRTGYDYNCGVSGGDCTSGGTEFQFTGPGGGSITYKFASDASCGQTSTVKGCILRSTDGGSTFLPITAPEVIVANYSSAAAGLAFYLRGSPHGSPDALGGTSDNIQPNVVITVNGYIELPNGRHSEFHIQTSATERLYDR